MENKQFMMGLTAVSLMVLFSGCLGGGANEEKTLLVYCGAGMKDPMDEIAADYEAAEGVKVTYSYGGSGELFAKIDAQKDGDLFMPGSEFHMNISKQRGYADESTPVAMHTPVIMVAEGNPKGIQSIEDLADDGVRVSLGNEDACAICKLVPQILKNAGVYEDVQNNAVTTSRTTVNEMALDVALGEADAAIVWRSTAAGYVAQDRAEIVEINEKVNVVETIPIAVLKFSKNPVDAGKFKQYVVSRQDIWRKYGYEAVA